MNVVALTEIHSLPDIASSKSVDICCSDLDLLLGGSLGSGWARKATGSITISSVAAISVAIANTIVAGIGHCALRSTHRVLPSLGLPLIVILARIDVFPADKAEQAIEA